MNPHLNLKGFVFGMTPPPAYLGAISDGFVGERWFLVK